MHSVGENVINWAVKSKKSMINCIYNQLLPPGTVMHWKSLMFNNGAGPKAKFIMLSHYHGRMLTADRLIKWGLNANPICSLCCTEPKTRDHLFLHCGYTKQVWENILTWTQR